MTSAQATRRVVTSKKASTPSKSKVARKPNTSKVASKPKKATTPRKTASAASSRSKTPTKRATTPSKSKVTKQTKKTDTKKSKSATTKAAASKKKTTTTTTKTSTKKDTKSNAKSRSSTPKKSRASSTSSRRSVTPKRKSQKKPKVVKNVPGFTERVITDSDYNLKNLIREHVSKELLVELLECNNVKIAKSTKKDQVVLAVLEATLSKGEIVVLEKLNKTTIATIISELKGSEAESPNNKSELVTELKKITEGSLTPSLGKLSLGTLDQICESLGFKEVGSADDKVEGLTDEIRILGIQVLFDHTTYAYIKEVCDKAGLNTKGQKEQLVNRFLGQAYEFMLEHADVVPVEKKPKEEKKPRTKAPQVLVEIKKGISPLELHQYYTKDLEKFIKDKELKKGNNKKQMVKTILSFLDGDESVLAKNIVSKKRKRDEGDDASAASKKQKTE